MSKSEIQLNDVFATIVRGSEKLCSVVGSTMGPHGKSVIISSASTPKVTNDGVTVAKSVEVSDHAENAVIKLLREAAMKTNDIAGDGTTTATVLTHAILKEAAKYQATGINRWELKRGIDAAISEVVKALEKLATPCQDSETIHRVGTVSANGDDRFGSFISKAMEEVGINGVITAESGTAIETELNVVKGMQFDRGYISPHFVTNPKAMECELENPFILLLDKKLNSIRDMVPLLESVAKSGKPLMIIAEDVEGEALSTLVLNNIRGVVKVCAVKAPGFGDRRKAMLEDIAILTGAQVISEEVGLSLETATVDHMGGCKRVVINKDDTTIVDGSGDKKSLEERMDQIKAQMDEGGASDYDKEKFQERLAKLSGGVAVLKVGAATEAEMKANKDIVEDALNATKAAVEEGVVPGGGVALVRVASALDDLSLGNEDQDIGLSIVKQALYAPLRQIVTNCGGDASVVLNKVLEGKGNFGFNAAKSEYGDLMEMGIIDPAKVTRSALQNAASIAGMLITTDSMIIETPDDSKDDSGMGGMGSMGGMGGMM
jgi:chaperonin GroEL